MEKLIENHIFLINFPIGIISIIAGWIMLKYPPKKINSLYGYRTKSSMKNQERWEFAQKYSSKKMIRLGFWLSIFGLLGSLIQVTEIASMIVGLTAMISMFVILFFKVEKAIKEHFGNL